MPTTLEYALMAANSYAESENVVDPNNEIPASAGWTRFDGRDLANSGFLARAYRNSTGEIVISFGGTTFEGGTADQLRDWLKGNVPAAAGVTLARQVVDAARFYLDVLAANPGANISFTGHSLGGGLASLMAVFFDRTAATFDSAPFEKSADSFFVVSRLRSELVGAGYSLPSSFADYRAFDPVFGSLIPSPTRVARESNVSHLYLKGEALEYLRGLSGRLLLTAVGLTHPSLLFMALNVANIAGSEDSRDPRAVNGNGWGWPLFTGDPIDMHYMPLLVSFLQSQQLLDASSAHPELLQKFFTSRLNFKQETADRNFINLMVRQNLNGASDTFAQDVQRLNGGLSAGKIKAALVSLGMGMHYGQGIDRATEVASGLYQPVFESLGGGIQFSPRPEHSQFTSEGLRELHDALGNLYPNLDRFIVSSERYSLQSEGNLVATASADAKFDLMLGGSGADQLSSGDGRDRLFGLEGTDTLDAGGGNDILVGGPGDDVLKGGTGLDHYYRRAGDGNDQIIEEREGGGLLGGRIVLESDAGDTPVAGLFLQQGTSQVWNAAEGGMTLTHGANWILTLADGSTLDLGADIQNGDFGIYLGNAPQPIVTDRTIVGDLAPVDFDPGTPGIQTRVDDLGNIITDPGQPEPGRADLLFDSAGNDDIRAFAGADVIEASRGGNDKLDGGEGRDIVSGRAGDDIVIGGTDGDLLRGDAGKDKVFGDDEVTLEAALAAQDAAGTGLRGDFIDGGSEDDILVSGASNDALNGGSGADLIITGAGDDDVDGDLETSIVSLGWSVTREVIDLGGGTTLYNRIYNGVGFLPPSPGGDDVVHGGAGADWLFTDEGNDWVDGGAGEDVVFGEAGADEIFGGGGNDKLFGDSSSVPIAQHGDDFIDGEDGNDEMNGDGGDDALFGGEGNDRMFGDSTDIGGTDYLDGEGGDDTILGAGNSDTIFGGDGADFLQGDSGSGVGDGNDFISGEAGDDILIGEGGDDELHGGADADILVGNAGMDVLLGDAGNDQIVGDEGGTDPSGDADFIDGGEGSDFVDGQGGDDIIAGGAGDDHSFFGGSLLGGAGNDSISGDAGMDQLHGGEGDDVLDGGSEDDVLFGESGNDTLVGGGGNDQLIGGLGDDAVNGGDGDDVYFYSLGDGNDRIADSGGTDFLVFNNFVLGNLRLDVGSLKIVLPDGGEVHLDDFDPDNPLAGSIEFFQFADSSVLSRQQVIQALGFQIRGTPGDDALSGTALNDPIQAFGGSDAVMGRGGNDSIDLGAGDDYADGGDGNDSLLGGDGHDLLEGGAGIDLLTGGLGDDRLGGGAGNDQPLDGGAGNDTYLFGSGYGQDVAIDAQGVNGVQLVGGLLDSQVTLQRAGNDLVILVTGTADRFTARDWFSNPAAWNQLGLGDGTVLDRAGVQARLVQNQPPLLAPDSADVTEDGILTASGDALANDVDPEGRALRVTNPGTFIGAHGSLSLASTGAFTYTLNNASLAVQSLGANQAATNSFSYTATDDDPTGAASASSQIVVTISGRNDAPMAFPDSNFAVEDAVLFATGDVLENDRDVDAGTTLLVGNPGIYTGIYGTLSLGVDGNYSYSLDNDSLAVQSLPRFEAFPDTFSYGVTDGIAASSSTLDVFVEGQNDAPVVAIPLVDQSVRPGRSFTYAVAAGSFTDVDQGDELIYSAVLADGSELPAWLAFDAQTQTFSGSAPGDATGFLDIEVTAADGDLGGESSGLFTSDEFRLSFEDGGGGGGGGVHGNEGVGNGEDPPPPGHDFNFNDGAGTSPGNPGAKGGHGLGHLQFVPAPRVLPDPPQRHQLHSAAAVCSFAVDQALQAEHGRNATELSPVQSATVDDAPGLDVEAHDLQPEGPQAESSSATPGADPGGGYDPVAAQLAQQPDYDFAILLEWFASDGSTEEALGPAEIALRWQRVSRYLSALSSEHGEDMQHGAGAWRFLSEGLLGAGVLAERFGYAGSTGAARPVGNFETLQGLDEGFRQL